MSVVNINFHNKEQWYRWKNNIYFIKKVYVCVYVRICVQMWIYVTTCQNEQTFLS